MSGLTSASSPNRPIGVFDSGLGGLTVLRELYEQLPYEQFLYLGDVARLPYGTKSPSVVERYARQCIERLLGLGVKMVVVACNTATALALEQLQDDYEVPILGVIESGVDAAIEVSTKQRVLVLATPSTVRSETYPRAFLKRSANFEVRQKACPLLVPLAEEGWYDHPITASVISAYLSETQAFQVDTVLLGCTHYPLLEPSFRKALWPDITLVHGGLKVAERVRDHLTIHHQAALQPYQSAARIRFMATDAISTSLPILKRLFSCPVDFEVVDLLT